MKLGKRAYRLNPRAHRAERSEHRVCISINGCGLLFPVPLGDDLILRVHMYTSESSEQV